MALLIAAAGCGIGDQLERSGDQSTYRWQYQRLLYGRPVQVDVLGIAPTDCLDEVRWLRPLSVIIFGIWSA